MWCAGYVYLTTFDNTSELNEFSLILSFPFHSLDLESRLRDIPCFKKRYISALWHSRFIAQLNYSKISGTLYGKSTLLMS